MLKFNKCIAYIKLSCIFVSAIKRKTKKTFIMETTLAKNWNKLEISEKLEIIENAINMCNTNEGFLMLRTWVKDNSVTAHVQKNLDNHLCSEAVSQDSLISLFGKDYDFQEEDAEVILNWMENQK